MLLLARIFHGPLFKPSTACACLSNIRAKFKTAQRFCFSPRIRSRNACRDFSCLDACEICGLAAFVLTRALSAADSAAIEFRIRSSHDGSEQPAMFFVPAAAEPGATGPAAPLIVSLHSWSTTHARYDSYASTLKGCRERGWVFISPFFRGPNHRPEACASELAIQDVLDAVEYAKAHARVDAARIYATGGSGGGHIALVMAHRAPKVWAGISTYVPITDLATFHRYNQESGLKFAAQVEVCCGGPPGNAAADQEYRKRSPIHFLAAARSIPIDINIGIHDGHNGGAVPADQGLRAFNVLAKANGHPEAMLSEAEIVEMTRTAQVPPGLRWTGADEPARRYRILLRREAGPVRLSVFDGGHVWDEGLGDDAKPALDWIAALHYKEKR